MGRAILIVLLVAIITFGIFSVQINRSSSAAGTASSNYYRDLYAKNIANSMVEILRTKLIIDTAYRVNNPVSENVMGGRVSYRLVDTTINLNNFVKAEVIANYEGVLRSTEAFSQLKK